MIGDKENKDNIVNDETHMRIRRQHSTRYGPPQGGPQTGKFEGASVASVASLPNVL